MVLHEEQLLCSALCQSINQNTQQETCCVIYTKFTQYYVQSKQELNALYLLTGLGPCIASVVTVKKGNAMYSHIILCPASIQGRLVK